MFTTIPIIALLCWSPPRSYRNGGMNCAGDSSWAKELDESVVIVGSDDVEEFLNAAHGTGMLVVDEAHHLSRDRALYEAVKAVAGVAPRLLLLSATPVLRNEAGFLQLLHLLDPLVFRLEDVDGFRLRIGKRQLLGETVAGLVPANALYLEGFIDVLLDAFPDDDLLLEHANALRGVLERFPDPADPELLSAITALRAHLSETCRLDRRILRNRRASVRGLTPERDGVSFRRRLATGAGRRLFEALESWRSLAAVSIYGAEASEAAIELAEIAAQMISDALDDPAALAECARRRASALADGSLLSVGDVAEEREALLAIAAAAQAFAEDDATAEALATLIAEDLGDRKYVVFCSDPARADRLAEELHARLVCPVDRYEVHDEEDGDGRNWRAFLDDRAHRVLVCDRRAEEGLNLQGGEKVLVHADLPLDPNRIEQRLGRLDRYGAGEAVKSIVLRYPDDPLRGTWAALLFEKDLGFSTVRLQACNISSMTRCASFGHRSSSKARKRFPPQRSASGETTGRSRVSFGKLTRWMRSTRWAEPAADVGSGKQLSDADDDWRNFQRDVEESGLSAPCLWKKPRPGMRLPPRARATYSVSGSTGLTR